MSRTFSFLPLVPAHHIMLIYYCCLVFISLQLTVPLPRPVDFMTRFFGSFLIDKYLCHLFDNLGSCKSLLSKPASHPPTLTHSTWCFDSSFLSLIYSALSVFGHIYSGKTKLQQCHLHCVFSYNASIVPDLLLRQIFVESSLLRARTVFYNPHLT